MKLLKVKVLGQEYEVGMKGLLSIELNESSKKIIISYEPDADYTTTIINLANVPVIDYTVDPEDSNTPKVMLGTLPVW